MRYQPGKVAAVIDCVGNYTRNPLFDADVEWSLTKTLKKKPRLNSEGDFLIRTCPQCFKVFKTAPVCPHCQTEYPLHPREIKAHQEIELQRISAEEAHKAEQMRRDMRMEVGRCKTIEDLMKIQKERGYAPAWVWKMARVKNIRV